MRCFFSCLHVSHVDPKSFVGVFHSLEEASIDSPYAHYNALCNLGFFAPFRQQIQFLVGLDERSISDVTGVVIRFSTPPAQYIIGLNNDVVVVVDDAIVATFDRSQLPEQVIGLSQPSFGIGEDVRKIGNLGGDLLR